MLESRQGCITLLNWNLWVQGLGICILAHPPANLKMTYWSSAHTPLVLHSVYVIPTQAPQLCALATRAWPMEAQM